MRSPYFLGMIYLFMGCSFVYFAIQQNKRTDNWDFLTIALMALASYDLIVAFKHFTFKSRSKNK